MFVISDLAFRLGLMRLFTRNAIAGGGVARCRDWRMLRCAVAGAFSAAELRAVVCATHAARRLWFFALSSLQCPGEKVNLGVAVPQWRSGLQSVSITSGGEAPSMMKIRCMRAARGTCSPRLSQIQPNTSPLTSGWPRELVHATRGLCLPPQLGCLYSLLHLFTSFRTP